MGSIENGRDCQILIVGAGIMGLTAALILKENGYRAKIIARDLPTDVESQDFSSPWAGASWDSFAAEDDPDAQRREIKTYRKFEELLQVLDRSVLIRAPNTVMLSKNDWRNVKENGKWFADKVRDFRLSPEGETPSMTYATFFMSVPLYTEWIVSQLKTTPNPVEIHRVPTIESISSALNHEPSAKLIINATGLGSKSLSDIQDSSLLPIRGQTLLIKAEEFSKNPRGVTSRDAGTDLLAYVIPRASSGTTILGGTYIENSTDGKEDKATTERILKRCSEICPEIVPGNHSSNIEMNGWDHQAKGQAEDVEAWKRIQVERVNVGFRPARASGPRVGLDQKLKARSSKGDEIPVLHSYGLGPAGYQTSWGVAEEVLELVKQCIPISS